MHKILIVDDDMEILKLMKNALELKNYAVTVIQEVTLPVKLAEFQGYDLILLDIMLTNISGIELCKQLRNQIATRSSSLVLRIPKMIFCKVWLMVGMTILLNHLV